MSASRFIERFPTCVCIERSDRGRLDFRTAGRCLPPRAGELARGPFASPDLRDGASHPGDPLRCGLLLMRLAGGS
jgi:hypothetical protein